MPEPDVRPSIVHRPRAYHDLAEIAEFLLDESTSAARNFLLSAKETITELAATPLIGPVQEFTSIKHLKLRKWSVRGFPSYLIFYRPLEDGSGIEVFTIVHAARDLESILNLLSE